MNETAAHAQDNGVIRIGTKGRKKFAFGDGQPFLVDVVDLSNKWAAIDTAYREPDGTVAPSKMLALNNDLWNFVREETGVMDISKAEAIEFMKHVTDEATALSDFFVPKSVKDAPSSPESTTTLRYSD